MVTLYHGTTTPFAIPDLSRSRKGMDFGAGFYATSNRESAARWAAKTSRLRRGVPTVLAFRFDEEGARVVTIRCDETMNADDFRLRVTADGLQIVGGRRGVLYGVYEVLETYGGVGWYTPEITVVPRCDSFGVPADLDVRQHPAFELREALWYEVFRDADFAVRLRLDGQRVKAEARHGGCGPSFGGGLGNCHTFAKLVPAEKYAKTHPEYFALVNGTRDTRKDERPAGGPDGNVLEAGLWDSSNWRSIANWTRRAKAFATSDWCWLDLGTFSADTPEVSLWVSGGRFDKKSHKTNPALTALYVDRVELRRVP